MCTNAVCKSCETTSVQSCKLCAQPQMVRHSAGSKASSIQCIEYHCRLLINTTAWEYLYLVGCLGPLTLTHSAAKQIIYWDSYAEHFINVHHI